MAKHTCPTCEYVLERMRAGENVPWQTVSLALRACERLGDRKEFVEWAVRHDEDGTLWKITDKELAEVRALMPRESTTMYDRLFN